MKDQQLFLYLENFRIKLFDQHDMIDQKCALCRCKNKCCTLTFEHIKTDYTLVRPMCESCANEVRKMYSKLKSMENIDA